MSNVDGARLIEELLADPKKFSESGRAYILLQAYFAGFPKETLRPLLESDDVWVQRTASFVVSELGRDAASLASAFPRLLNSRDEHVVWYAMEALAVCATAEGSLAPVVLMLESPSEPLRRLAMRLLARVDTSLLEGAHRYFDVQGGRVEAHIRGLAALTDKQLSEASIATMVGQSEPLTRRYGAIAASRFRTQFPGTRSFVDASDDADVRSAFR
jgi:hypothetical protein